MAPNEHERKAVIDAVLNLFDASGTAAFKLPIPNTTPPLYIYAGEAKHVLPMAQEEQPAAVEHDVTCSLRDIYSPDVECTCGAAPTLAQGTEYRDSQVNSEDARARVNVGTPGHKDWATSGVLSEGDTFRTHASETLSEKVEPVADVQNGNVRWLVDGWPDNTKLYTLPPTAQQALRMAADAAYYAMSCPVSGTADPAEVRKTILALLPPTDPYQQARAEGFAEAKKLAKEIVEQHFDWAEHTCEMVVADIDALQPTSTPSQATVTMTREELEAKLYAAAQDAFKRSGYQDEDELIRAIVAQHMPKESK